MSEAPLSFRKSANVDRVTDKRQDSLFRLVDTDGSGTIDAQEFAVLYDAIKKDLAEELEKEAQLQKEASSARRRVKMLLLFVAVLVSFLAASVAANFAVIFTVVDQAVTTTASSTGLLEVKGSDTIAKTAIAAQDIPLMVAPALDMDTLSEVKSLKVTYGTGMGQRVQAQLSIVGVRKHNSTFVEFVTDIAGETVETLNGVANLVRYPNAANGLTRPRKLAICSANATCSAFRASGIDINAALDLARTELARSGFHEASRRLDPILDDGACDSSGSWQAIDCSSCNSGNGAGLMFFDGYSSVRHVVFMLHGFGGSWYNGMYMTHGVDGSYNLDEFRHLIFVYPNSGITTHNHYSGSAKAGWQDYVNDTLTFDTGAVVLATMMCGHSAWATGDACGSGTSDLSSYGVGGSSEVMVIGMSNGGAMAIYGSWKYGDTITRASSIDYAPFWDVDTWLPTTYASSSATGFAAKVYFGCDSAAFFTDGIVSAGSGMTYWSGIGATGPDGPPTVVPIGNSLVDEYPGGGYQSSYDFVTETFTGTDGRFFAWAVHGYSTSMVCDSNEIPDDWAPAMGRMMPDNMGWNIHSVLSPAVKEALVQDILDWVSPSSAPPPAPPTGGGGYKPVGKGKHSKQAAPAAKSASISSLANMPAFAEGGRAMDGVPSVDIKKVNPREKRFMGMLDTPRMKK